ncbi:MAG: host-nuclease inhibitor Gam family protein [Ignavibacteriales bacterium]|nr:host-nuclease inhibitor Gam family protein [Ignavibacteriales bacterium]
MTSFMDELLAEVEEKEQKVKIELDRLKADQLLMAVAKLESQMDDVNTLADDEIKLIEQYRKSEIERLDKKRSWLLFNVESFWRVQSEQTGEKTLRLPHGTLTLRKGRDKIEIDNLAIFLKIAPRNGWLRTTPEKHEPDLAAIAAHIKRTGEIPLGTKLIPAGVNFSYQLNNNGGPSNGTE